MSSQGQVNLRVDSHAKLTGSTRYVHDLQFAGTLVGGILRSPHPHARIRSIDVSKAKQVEGVQVVLTGQDVPQTQYGPTKFKDWNILANERVLFIGDEVAAVAGTDKKAVDQALQAIEVEYEILTSVLDPEKSLNAAAVVHEEAPDNRPLHIKLHRGDVDQAMSEAYIVKGGRYTTNRIYQGHLEPIGMIANWDEEEGLTLWTPSHIPYRARETYAAALGLPEERVRIIVPPIGGSFGSKYVLKAHIIAAVLAQAAKAPVKIILDRHEDMITAHPRVPLTIDIKIAADRDGKFLAKDVVVYADAGARIYWSPNVVATACTRPDSLYNFDSVRAEGHLCYTNNSPTTCMRGFGNAEMLFAVESVIDELAIELQMDPAEIRLRNIVRAHETTIHGYQLETCELEQCIHRVKELSNWDRRDQLPPYRGLGIALGNHVAGYRGIDPRFEGSTAVVRLSVSGQITVETGEIDLGQGMSSTYAKIVERVVGVPADQVLVLSGDTARYPFALGTLASRSTVMGGNAVQLAAAKFLAELTDFVHQKYGPHAVFEQGVVHVQDQTLSLAEVAQAYRGAHAGDDLIARASYTPNTDLPDQTFYGNPSPSYPFAAHVAEVEVDPDTGRTKVVGYWAVHDSGMILNRTAAVSQVIGGVAQGIGWVTMENLIVREGRVENSSLMDYRMPGVSDVPPVQVDFVEVHDPNGPFGAKSVGEIAIDPVPGAIANAIAHAIGQRGYRLPLSPERVWQMLKDNQK